MSLKLPWIPIAYNWSHDQSKENSTHIRKIEISMHTYYSLINVNEILTNVRSIILDMLLFIHIQWNTMINPQ